MGSLRIRHPTSSPPHKPSFPNRPQIFARSPSFSLKANSTIILAMSQVAYTGNQGVSNVSPSSRVSSYGPVKAQAFPQDLPSNSTVANNSSDLGPELLQNRLNNNYQLAIRQYLNKNFAKSWTLVTSLISQLDLNDIHVIGSSEMSVEEASQDELVSNIYKLYLSLIDLLLKEDQNSVGNGLYEEIHTIFQEGVIFRQIVQVYNHNYHLIDPELALMCFIIELSNKFPLVNLDEQMETYLLKNDVFAQPFHINQLPGPMDASISVQDRRLLSLERVVEFYLVHVLSQMNQIPRAKELIARIFSSDAQRVLRYSSLLDEHLHKVKEAELLREKELLDRERNHKHFKKDFFSKKPGNDTAKQTRQVSRPMGPKSQDDKKLQRPSSTPRQVSLLDKLKRLLFPPYSVSNTPQVHWILQMQRFIRPLVASCFIISLLLFVQKLSTSKSNLMAQLKRLRVSLWVLLAKILDTFRMAFKISYI
ncbi:hypothetical protein PP7435_CHR4-0482 [Komagataella phaffii CBS 7435]|uniref:Uncharacterized protein n=2 Tax=Komagataella phaffii TaxID=460519 RepID=C4R825_KOMPG|nr:Hypothetical protein PAS_chr4_0495 [Komagataella phaffii GS115]CAH2450859.1 hypothetical protein BQ9382_C4-2510 [Komagataella phaffii CBS 7435]CAY71750.1 Hypothetical protein PAS_chr4_0495 [Komagataella phaffii GS115]CCA40648.1 hypothetical protein PP7435_CHR4-0482 [Komagataella phaffii CBS 7435]